MSEIVGQFVVDGVTRPIVLDAAAQRFELREEGGVARLEIRLVGDVLVLVHTEVPPSLRGKGAGAALVQAALEHAATNGLRVRPSCPFAAAFLARHDEYRALIDPDAGALRQHEGGR